MVTREPPFLDSFQIPKNNKVSWTFWRFRSGRQYSCFSGLVYWPRSMLFLGRPSRNPSGLTVQNFKTNCLWLSCKIRTKNRKITVYQAWLNWCLKYTWTPAQPWLSLRVPILQVVSIHRFHHAIPVSFHRFHERSISHLPRRLDLNYYPTRWAQSGEQWITFAERESQDMAEVIWYVDRMGSHG